MILSVEKSARGRNVFYLATLYPWLLQVMDPLSKDWLSLAPHCSSVATDGVSFTSHDSFSEYNMGELSGLDSRGRPSGTNSYNKRSSVVVNMNLSPWSYPKGSTDAVERPHACAFCSRTFILKHHLKQHVRLHTGERPYVCDICGNKFVQQASLMNHKKYHALPKSDQT